MKNATIGLKYIAIFFVVCLFSSCATSLVSWNQAITNFNKGAEMELKNHYADRLNVVGELPAEALPNLKNLAMTSSVSVEPAESPEKFFQRADEKITEALQTPGALVKENKMGNALTLKALTCWKTGQPAEARANAMAAMEKFETSGEDSPRDKALAKAVPGLVALDLAYDSTKVFVQQLKTLSDNAPNASREANEKVLKEGRRLYGEFIAEMDSDHSVAAARSELQEAILLAGEHKDTRLYLQLCELTGLKNRYDFWAQLNNFAKRSGIKTSDEDLREWLDREEESYLNDKDAALEKVKNMLGGDAQNSVYRFWDGNSLTRPASTPFNVSKHRHK